MEACKEILRQVFGNSSEPDPNQKWVEIEQIKGLWLCRDFLSPQNQSALLSTIQNEGWFTEASHNQAMRFGDLPGWAAELSDSINNVLLSWGCCDSNVIELGSSCGVKQNVCPFSSELLAREPLFDQMILNSYQPGEIPATFRPAMELRPAQIRSLGGGEQNPVTETRVVSSRVAGNVETGICAHVDLMRFEDGIAIISLESSCVMHFSPVEGTSGDFLVDGEKDPLTTKIPVYLTPGSLILMSGEARYQWKHEINRKPEFQMWQGEELIQKKRISIILRELCQVE